MSTYVLSDIHGCYDELISALDKISFSEADTLYVLGDLFDRGPKNADVLKWFISTGNNVKFIRGNHDDFMLDETRMDYKTLELHEPQYWIYNKYFLTSEDLLNNTTEEERKKAFEKIAASKYYEHLTVNDNEFLLVHAGFNIPYNQVKHSVEELLENQIEYDMTWIRDEWINYPNTLPCYVVFGHTQTDSIKKKHLYDISVLPPEELAKKWSILQWNRKIAIDCGACNGGRIGILRLDDFAEFYSDFSMNTLKNVYASGDEHTFFDWQYYMNADNGKDFRAGEYAMSTFDVISRYALYIPEIQKEYNAMCDWLTTHPNNKLFSFIIEEIERAEQNKNEAVQTENTTLTIEEVGQYIHKNCYADVVATFDLMPLTLQQALTNCLSEKIIGEQN